ncbi:MAG: NTP transferase domain-containing protein, partial [Deltaproteobacteria bacterium]
MTNQPNEPVMASLCAVILAAGKGTRMKSNKAKVLHRVFGLPMICHVVAAVQQAGVREIIVVTGHQRQEVEDCLAAYTVSFAYQQEQLGTGHAVACARQKVGVMVEDVLILCGDTPLVAPSTLVGMASAHRRQRAMLTVMTTFLDNPTNYGRIVTGKDGD